MPDLKCLIEKIFGYKGTKSFGNNFTLMIHFINQWMLTICVLQERYNKQAYFQQNPHGS
jgi:hypothetical protein